MTFHRPAPTLANRSAFYGQNKLIIGLFGANCSSGRDVTLVEKRWSGRWQGYILLDNGIRGKQA